MGKRLLGIKLICMLFLLSAIGSFVLFSSNPALFLLKASNETKQEMIQSEYYKKLNITSIEEFDKYVLNNLAKLESKFKPWFLFRGIISLILVLGLWKLNEWARLGLIIYTIFSTIVNLLIRLLLPTPGLIDIKAIITIIFSLATTIVIIFYLTRPKVKEQFK